MYKSLNAAASGVKEIYQTSQEKGKKEIMGGKGKERAEWWVLVTDTWGWRGGGAKGARRVTHREPKERSLLGES